MTAKKVAHEIIVDVPSNTVLIDGVGFPYHVMAEPEIMTVGDEVLGAVRLDILASNVVVVESTGKRRVIVKASLGAELEWARRRATELVIEDLAPILKQLGKEQR